MTHIPALLCAASFALALQAQAGDPPPRPPEPPTAASFVRTHDNQIAFTDRGLRTLVNAHVGPGRRWFGADIVMQQCYSGGFTNDLMTGLDRRVTLTTACSWNEIAWTVQESEGSQRAVENFTTAWVNAARTNPNDGVRTLATKATEADLTGPINRAFWASQPEHPTYSERNSDDGYDDGSRTLMPNADHRIFTGIGIYGAPNTIANRHFTNAVRVADLMRTRTSNDQVAALYSSGSVQNIAADGVVRPDPVELPSLAISGATTRANVIKMFDGSLFSSTQRQDGDRLVFYVTGHGGRADFKKLGTEVYDSRDDNINDSRRWHVNFGQQREAGGQPFPTYNPNMFGDSDDLTGMDNIQIHLLQALPQGAHVLINGIDFTGSLLQVLDPSLVRELPDQDDLEPTPFANFVYSLSLPRDVLRTSSAATLDIQGLGFLTGEESLLLAMSMYSGDGEYIAVNIPSPAGLMVVAGFGAMGLVRRRRYVCGPHGGNCR